MANTNIQMLHYPLVDASQYVYVADDAFTEEMKAILAESGCENDIKAMLKQRVKYLVDKKHEAIRRPNWFEKLRGYPGLFSLKLKHTDLNLRILYSLAQHNGKPKCIFLLAFLEKEHGRRQSYSQYASPALKRLAEVKRRMAQ